MTRTRSGKTTNRTKTSRSEPVISEVIELSSDSEESSCSDVKENASRKSSPKTPRKTKNANCEAFTTPPKQKKPNDKPPETPSSILQKLSLKSPEEKSNRKQLFVEEANKSKLSTLQEAKKALHSTLPGNLPGREQELEDLRLFINKNLEAGTSASLYVSGPPGTGKTASLSTILQELQDYRQVYVNCTAIKSAGAIYGRIAKELNIKLTGKTEKDCLETVENHLKKKQKLLTLIVLDEIDQLESKNQSILYTIFEWPARFANSKILLIGIANALDLTDRILPRLQAKCELKPKLMHFAPYSKGQIVDILTQRLKSADVLQVFSPAALQMLAGKVASVSGDVRRALDIARRVIEVIDQKFVLKSLENSEVTNKIVDLKQVMEVLNNVYGTAQHIDEETEDSFPLQQKIVVCCVVLVKKHAKNKDITVGKLHEVYRKVCKKLNLHGVDQAEFVGLCQLIETRGIIRVVAKKEPRLSKVCLEWDEEEVSGTLKDKQLMSNILQDSAILGKM